MRARRGQELYQRWRDGDLPRTVRCRDVEAVLETYLPGRYSRGPDGSYIIRHVAFAALSGRHAGLRVQAQQQRWDRWAVEELMLRIAWIREWRWWCQMNGWDEDEFQDLEVLKLQPPPRPRSRTGLTTMTTQVDRQRQAGEWAQRDYVIATNYDGDSGRWHAWAPQFGIRMARGVGGTEEEAKDELRRSLQVVFEGMAEVGEQPALPVPADKLDLDKDRPLATNLPSGKLVVRLGRELHAALIEGAERNNTSLNNYIVMLLSRQNAFDEIRAVAESA